MVFKMIHLTLYDPLSSSILHSEPEFQVSIITVTVTYIIMYKYV